MSDLERLKRAAVYLSDGFKTILELQLNEAAATVQSDSGPVHISGSNDLRIYIPRDPNDRKRCYSPTPSSGISALFELRDREAPLMFQLVFLTPEDFIDDLLDAQGIIRSSPDVPDHKMRTQDLPISRDISGFGEIDMLDDGTYTPRSSYESIQGSEERTVSHHRAVLSTPQPFTVQYTQEVRSRPAVLPVLDHHYLRVLDDIIKLARLLPFHEALRRPETTGQENVGHELAFGVRSDGQIKHAH